MTTYKDVIDDLRLRFNDIEQNKIPTPLIVRVLKDAIEDIVEDMGGLIDVRYAYSVANRGIYLLSPEISHIEQLTYDGTLLEYVNYRDFIEDKVNNTEDMWNSLTTGTPKTYTTFLYGIENRKILILYPFPNEADKIIRITCKILYPEITADMLGQNMVLPNEITQSVRDRATFLLARELNNKEMTALWRVESEIKKREARPTQLAFRIGEGLDV